MYKRLFIQPSDLLKVDLVRFCMVGALGFAVNFAILSLLYGGLGWPLFMAQLIAGEIALFNNFYIHHTWTYKGRATMKTIKKLLLQFHATSWFAVILTSIVVTLSVNVLSMHYTLALILAASTALLWNFVWSKYVIWADASNNSGAGGKDKN